MDPADRNRRFITILILCAVYLAFSLLQSLVLDKIESSGIISDAQTINIKSPKKLKENSEYGGGEKPNFKGDNEDRNEERDDDAQISKIYIELKSCLPRFICEVHAQGPSFGGGSDLEKDILSLFKNYLYLEGPSSPVYTYQIAAHMGQLASGLIPSPCQNMYPSCPLSRAQLLELLAGVKTVRRSWL